MSNQNNCISPDEVLHVFFFTNAAQRVFIHSRSRFPKVSNQVTAYLSQLSIKSVEASLKKGHTWEKNPNDLHCLDGLSLMKVEIPGDSQEINL